MTKVIRVKKKCEKCNHKRSFLKIKNGMKRFRCGFCKNIVMEKFQNDETKTDANKSKKKL